MIDIPFGSGMMKIAHTISINIIAAKNAKAQVPVCATATGKSHETSMHITQCTVPPKLCPFARTSGGKISEMNTQMTALAENATAAINP